MADGRLACKLLLAAVVGRATVGLSMVSGGGTAGDNFICYKLTTSEKESRENFFLGD